MGHLPQDSTLFGTGDEIKRSSGIYERPTFWEVTALRKRGVHAYRQLPNIIFGSLPELIALHPNTLPRKAGIIMATDSAKSQHEPAMMITG